MVKNKVIFLDIDGPLVNWRTHYATGKRGSMRNADPILLQALINCGKSGVKIVISSSWRKATSLRLKEHLDLWGLSEYLHSDSYTPIIPTWEKGERENEIFAWVKKHPEIHQYLVIDDEAMVDVMQPFWIPATSNGVNSAGILRIMEFAGFYTKGNLGNYIK